MPGFRWIFLLCLAFTQNLWAFDGIRVTLLGTGGVTPSMERFGPATLVEAGDDVLLFDSGRGVTQRLAQAGVSIRDVGAVFLTDVGSERTLGLADLWLTGWLQGRRSPLLIYGPEGTQELVNNLERAFRAEVESRPEAQRKIGSAQARDIAENVVYESEDVTVTAIVVDHGLARTTYAYRVDLRHRHSIVISGAARYSENLIHSARGVRLLVQEVAAADPGLAESSERVRDVLSVHASPDVAARIFREVRPYLAVYAPIVLVEAGEDELMRRTHAIYPGAVELGHDQMVIEIQDEVQVRAGPSEPRQHRD